MLRYKGSLLLAKPKLFTFHTTGAVFDPPPVNFKMYGKSNVGAEDGIEEGSPVGIVLG
jgi:hypothetical protein